MRDSILVLILLGLFSVMAYLILLTIAEIEDCAYPDSRKYNRVLTVVERDQLSVQEICSQEKVIVADQLACFAGVEERKGVFLTDLIYTIAEKVVNTQIKRPENIKQTHNTFC